MSAHYLEGDSTESHEYKIKPYFLAGWYKIVAFFAVLFIVIVYYIYAPRFFDLAPDSTKLFVHSLTLRELLPKGFFAWRGRASTAVKLDD